MKKIACCFSVLFCAALNAAQIEVTAKSFVADENEQRSHFSGSVVVVRGADTLRADKISLAWTKTREIKVFEADGNASFDITTDNGTHFVGRANRLIYTPADGLYSLKGHAVVEDRTNQRKIEGESIVLNELTRVAKVDGEESVPVKLIFTIKDQK
ncbi:hypothetical protein AGMMS50229_16050 [Campylobacterota bacterium]|nr:hypothetical protein AGMMS50229_16050 [Campylobacterota bacterium]